MVAPLLTPNMRGLIAFVERPGSAVHLGEEANRIDLLAHLKGIDNDTLFSAHERIRLDGCPVRMISFEHLIIAERASSHTRDLADADELLKSKKLSER